MAWQVKEQVQPGQRCGCGPGGELGHFMSLEQKHLEGKCGQLGLLKTPGVGGFYKPNPGVQAVWAPRKDEMY